MSTPTASPATSSIKEHEHEFRISCPKCSEPMWVADELEGKAIECPHCGHGFEARRAKYPAVPKHYVPPTPPASLALTSPAIAATRGSPARRAAEKFSQAASIFFAGAILAIVIATMMGIGQEFSGALVCLYVAGGIFAWGLILYVVTQVLLIRAAVEEMARREK